MISWELALGVTGLLIGLGISIFNMISKNKIFAIVSTAGVIMVAFSLWLGAVGLYEISVGVKALAFFTGLIVGERLTGFFN